MIKVVSEVFIEETSKGFLVSIRDNSQYQHEQISLNRGMYKKTYLSLSNYLEIQNGNCVYLSKVKTYPSTNSKKF